MTGTVLGSGVNIILDPIFIFVLGLGAAGAAIATVLGNICADIFFVWFLLKKSKKLSVNPLGFHISADEISQIMAIGFPASITNFMQSFGIALMNRFLLPYGNERVAAMGIVMKINMIAVLILVGFAFYSSRPRHHLYFSVGRKSMERLPVIRQQTGRALCRRNPARRKTGRLLWRPDGAGRIGSAHGTAGGLAFLARIIPGYLGKMIQTEKKGVFIRRPLSLPAFFYDIEPA